VAQLALPELTRRAPTRPPVEAMWRRPTVMGAATTRFEVNMAAPTVPVEATARARSGLPESLIPAVAAPQRKPPGMCSGLAAGVSVVMLSMYQGI